MISSSPVGASYYISSSDQSSTSIFPIPLLFYGKIRDDWVVKELIVLRLERDDDGDYIISEDAFNIYGSGPTVQEAQEDFIAALTEYYEILKKYAKADSASSEALNKFSRIWLPPA